MVAIILLFTATSTAAFTHCRISRIIRHRVTHSSMRRLTLESSTPNEKTDSEVAKQALSDYIARIRPKILSYSHHPDLTVIDNNNCIKVSADEGDQCRGLIWDKSIHKYSVKIDTSSKMDISIGFAPSKLCYLDGSNSSLCGWLLFLDAEDDEENSCECKGKVGDTITCIYNSFSSEISFEKNGVSRGVVYGGVNGEDIAPVVELNDVGDSITLFAISN
jgi:SPRY domain